MNKKGTYSCSYSYKIDEYQAFGQSDREYFENKYLNPWYGYYFTVEVSDDLQTQRVVFTNGINSIYPTPNNTQWLYEDGTIMVVDNASGEKRYQLNETFFLMGSTQIN